MQSINLIVEIFTARKFCRNYFHNLVTETQSFVRNGKRYLCAKCLPNSISTKQNLRAETFGNRIVILWNLSCHCGNISFDISSFLLNCEIPIREDKKLIRLRMNRERTLRRTLPLRTLKRTQSLKPIKRTTSLMTLRVTIVRNLSIRTLNRTLLTEDQWKDLSN